MEKKSDFMVATEAFLEEMEGIEDYSSALPNIKDATLRRTITEIINVEKQHANTLLSWINNQAKTMLR
jgi:hypothetical protein